MLNLVLIWLAVVIRGCVAVPLNRKYNEISEKRWETKLVRGMQKAELEEMEAKWGPTDEEIIEATKEWEKEMSEW